MNSGRRDNGIGKEWRYAAYAHYKRSGGPVAMCSSTPQAAAKVTVGGEIDVSADVAMLDSQIKAKGEAIRELKAGGAAKDSLKLHIEVGDYRRSNY